MGIRKWKPLKSLWRGFLKLLAIAEEHPELVDELVALAIEYAKKKQKEKN